MSPVTLTTEPFTVLKKDRSWLRLYNAAFPKVEQDKRMDMLRDIRGNDALLVCARKGRALIGFAIVHLLHDFPAVYLLYLVVDPAQRGKHIGTQLFEAAWRAGQRAMKQRGIHPKGYLWEVEIPALARTSRERALRQKRIHFYEHAGARVLHRRYTMPPVDGVHTLPMHIMFRPALHAVAAIDHDEYHALVESMYAEKYAVMNHIPRPVLQHLLDRIP